MVALGFQEGRKVRNRNVILAAYPEGMPRESDFKILDSEMDFSLEANSGDVAVKVMFISLDPVARTRMGWAGFVFPFFDIGKEPIDHYRLKNLFQTIAFSAKLEGLLVLHYLDHLSEYLEEVAGYLKSGKLVYKEHITGGIENWPAAFVGMMNGDNIGKAVVRVRGINITSRTGQDQRLKQDNLAVAL